MPSPSVRPLGAGDAKAYRALRLTALDAEPSAFSSSPADDAGFTAAEVLSRAVPERPGPTFGAFAVDLLAGMAGYVPERRAKTRHEASMVGVFLRPEWRGGGNGSRQRWSRMRGRSA